MHARYRWDLCHSWVGKREVGDTEEVFLSRISSISSEDTFHFMRYLISSFRYCPRFSTHGSYTCDVTLEPFPSDHPRTIIVFVLLLLSHHKTNMEIDGWGNIQPITGHNSATSILGSWSVNSAYINSNLFHTTGITDKPHLHWAKKMMLSPTLSMLPDKATIYKAGRRFPSSSRGLYLFRQVITEMGALISRAPRRAVEEGTKNDQQHQQRATTKHNNTGDENPSQQSRWMEMILRPLCQMMDGHWSQWIIHLCVVKTTLCCARSNGNWEDAGCRSGTRIASHLGRDVYILLEICKYSICHSGMSTYCQPRPRIWDGACTSSSSWLSANTALLYLCGCVFLGVCFFLTFLPLSDWMPREKMVGWIVLSGSGTCSCSCSCYCTPIYGVDWLVGNFFLRSPGKNNLFSCFYSFPRFSNPSPACLQGFTHTRSIHRDYDKLSPGSPSLTY